MTPPAGDKPAGSASRLNHQEQDIPIMHTNTIGSTDPANSSLSQVEPAVTIDQILDYALELLDLLDDPSVESDAIWNCVFVRKAFLFAHQLGIARASECLETPITDDGARRKLTRLIHRIEAAKSRSDVNEANLIIADDNRALADRLLYAEAALHHVADAISMDLPGLPTNSRPPSRYRLTFGKHAGATLDEVPQEYLLWLADEADSPTVRTLARQQLGCIEEYDVDPNPSPELAAVVMPRLIFLWCEEMQAKYKGNTSALAVVMEGFAKLKAVSSKLTGKPWPTDTDLESHTSSGGGAA